MKQYVNLALGMFDGVHTGHKELIKKAAALQGAVPAVFTFANHPADIFNRSVKLLSLPEEKMELLQKCGTQIISMQPFDQAFSQLSPDEYIHFLARQFDIKSIIIGYNHVFGKEAEGNGETLIHYGKMLGFKIYILPPVLLNNEPVSSTLIRQMLAKGDIEKANEMLGHHYFAGGTVVNGKRIGASIGFPTANIAVSSKKQLPKEGVYITLAKYKNTLYRSITNIGRNPTVSSAGEISIETHIFRFNQEIYDETVRIYFIKRLRDEIKFEGTDALAAQINSDIQVADAYLNIFLKTNATGCL